jgi:hypothetical protein
MEEYPNLVLKAYVQTEKPKADVLIIGFMPSTESAIFINGEKYINFEALNSIGLMIRNCQPDSVIEIRLSNNTKRFYFDGMIIIL